MLFLKTIGIFSVSMLIIVVICAIISLCDEYSKYKGQRKEADVLITYDEFIKYENMAPKRWEIIYCDKIKYTTNKCERLIVNFKTFRDWCTYKIHKEDRKKNQMSCIFLNSIKEDIETYLANINKETKKELEKIQERIPKTEEGKQDIDEFYKKINELKLQ